MFLWFMLLTQGSSNVGYDGMHGGIGYGDRNADGSSILEYADGLNMVISNTLFMKQESQMVTYAAGPVKSTVDYIILSAGTKKVKPKPVWIFWSKGQ